LRDADCGAFAAGFGLEPSICGTAEAQAGPSIERRKKGKKIELKVTACWRLFLAARS